MFDITSFVREKIFRRPKLNNEIPGEELSEKQTTKLGYFLLFCMFVAIMISAHWTLDIIKHIPNKPTPVPSCVYDMIKTFNISSDSSYNSYGYNNCSLTSTNPEFDLTYEYNKLKPDYEKIKAYQKEIRNSESKISNINYNQERLQSDYNTSMHEKTANENNKIFNSNNIKSTISKNRIDTDNYNQIIGDLNSNINNLKSVNSTLVGELNTKYEAASKDYRKAYLRYKFYIALLSFIFSIVVFFVLYKMYVKQKIKNSPHTIIFSIATFAYGLILLEIAIMFLWDLIPPSLLKFLSGLFIIFKPLIFIVQFLWPILIIAVFGFLVYKIQKRLYSPKNVLKRFISDKKCPNCGNGVDFTKPFCPLCSHEIQIDCSHCHELTLKGMPYCSNCGGKSSGKDSLTNKNSNSLDESLEKVLENINIEGYKGVRFISLDGKSFTSSRKNIVRLTIFMIKKLGKTKFEPNEFSPYLKELTKHIKKDKISEKELNRILGKIKSWIELGGEVKLLEV